MDRYLLRISLLALAALTIPVGTAGASFSGRNGRIAWAVYNAGGGGGGGYASLTSSNSTGGSRSQLGYCPEDDSGYVCTTWENVSYSPNGRHCCGIRPTARDGG
jgi:hypothetical protein